MKKIILLLLIISAINGKAQIQIDNNDMPKPDIQYYLSTNITANGIDYTATGEDYNWDFSTLFPLSNRTDSFVKVATTPMVYRLVFYNASVAQMQPSLDFIPGFTLTDIYSYYKSSATSYTQYGFGASLNGLTIPFRFDNADVIYKLPVKYGNIDSNTSVFKFKMDKLGYMSQIKNRKNYADGWGTVTTPFGTFQTLRVRTEISEKDSIYLDTLGIAFPAITRNYTEYKWLAKGYAVPILQINKELMTVNITYIDKPKETGLNETLSKGEIEVYPNPSRDEFYINIKSAEEEYEIELLTLEGKRILSLNEKPMQGKAGMNLIKINRKDISNGIYLLKMRTKNGVDVKKIVIN